MPHIASLHGLDINSDWPLPTVSVPPWFGTVRIQHQDDIDAAASKAGAQRTAGRWFDHARGTDGNIYLWWRDLLNVLVEPGGTIGIEPLHPSAPALIDRYLYAQLLSFPLLQFGVEPLHGVVLSRAARTFALLGDSGVGKSTLAAACLQSGCKLVTDDLIALRQDCRGWRVAAGPARIRLFPQSARKWLGAERGRPMNAFTQKRVYDVGVDMHEPSPAALTAVYLLQRGRRNATDLTRITELTPTAACQGLLRHTFNPLLPLRARQVQQLQFYADLIRSVPIRALQLRRQQADLSAAVERLLMDVESQLAGGQP